MKSVGNLTEFVRNHMLQAFDVSSRINALIEHFDDLSRAHNAVLKARDQVERLTPLSKNLEKHQQNTEKRQHLSDCRDGLKSYFTTIKAELLQQQISELEEKHQWIQVRVEKTETLYTRQQSERDHVRQAIAQNGGDRLQQLKNDIALQTSEKQKRQQRAASYGQLAKKLDLQPVYNKEDFLNNQQTIKHQLQSFSVAESELQNVLTEHTVALQTLRNQHHELSDDIHSLKQRRSNIERQQILIRSTLCEALGLNEQDVPFVGELIQIREDEQQWEGAIERILHNFGLSLLVPEQHYTAVAEWVDKTHLRGRLVYFRVNEKQKVASHSGLHPESLVRKITIKPDSGFFSWLEQQISRRFDYACCESMQQFRREKQAVTQSGQIKAGGQRHEKDDRHKLTDRTRYLLGWSNEAKISALKKALHDLEQQMDQLRQFRQANALHVAAADIVTELPVERVGDYLTYIAEVVLERVMQLAWNHLVERYGLPGYMMHGKLREAQFGVVAYGKFGGKEFGYGSDLDIVFLHDSCGNEQHTAGPKVLDNSEFFTRLSQRVIHILNTYTSAGILYEVDMRLRPNGASGLLVSSLEAFAEYQRRSAWTWENQALVRARVVAGWR